MKHLLFAVLAVAAITSCKKSTTPPADTTITTADVAKIFSAGSTLVTYGVNFSASIDQAPVLQAPTFGSNQTWNLGNIIYNSKTFTTAYTSAPAPFPTDAFQWSGNAASIVSSDSILEGHVFNISANGLSNLGYTMAASTITIPGLGTIKYPNQAVVNSKPMPETPAIPFKYGDSVGFTGVTQTENFIANAPGVGLNNVPGQQVFTVSGSAACWASGKLTLKGFSNAMDVLVVKVHMHTVANYFLGGAPAPTPLLSMLGITDGSSADEYWFDFYGAGGTGFLGTIYTDASGKIVRVKFRAK